MPDDGRSLEEAIAEAAAEPAGGPDLQAIARLAEGRRARRLRIAPLILVLAVIAGSALARIQSSATVESGLPVGMLRESESGLNVDPGVGLDARSLSINLEIAGFQYGAVTADDGRQVCIVKVVAGLDISVAGCKPIETLLAEHVLVFVTNSVPDLGRAHIHVAGLVVDGFDTVEFDGSSIPISANMFLISEPPYPSTITLVGPNREESVAVPEIPDPGAPPVTG